MKVNVLEIIWTMIQVMWYTITHPFWAWRAYQGYRTYRQNGGDFLDTDFYKLSMGFFIWKFFPNLGVRYQLKVRTDVEFPKGIDRKINDFAKRYAEKHTHISADQARWLKNLPFVAEIPAKEAFYEYVDFLADPNQPKIFAIHVKAKLVGTKLEVTTSGPWLYTVWWEIPLMAMISEFYYQSLDKKVPVTAWRAWAKAAKKGSILKKAGALFSEFGLRRRFSFLVQFMVNYVLIATGATKKPDAKKGSLKARIQFVLAKLGFKPSKGGLLGTSNVFLAYLFGLTPMGTMAHELFLVLGAVFGYEKANQMVIKLWIELFGTKLGYYLPDTYTSKEFRRRLTKAQAQHFTGPRQDSGEAELFTDDTVENYQALELTAEEIAQKTIVFSDALNVFRVLEILAYAMKKGIGAAFGIGTNFTNDFKEELGVGHLNMVVKPYEAWVLDHEETARGCIKISDEPFDERTPGKITGDPVAAEQVVNWLTTGEITWPTTWTIFDQEKAIPGFPVKALMDWAA
jgi:nicotinate phosphoribosyltransferase